MKKILLIFSTLFLAGKAQAINPIYGTVQITTTPVITPTFQQGTINIGSATIRTSLISTGTVVLGGTGHSVTISSNAVLSGQLVVNSSSGASGQTLQSRGPGSSPVWVDPTSSSLLSSTNTWTAGQTYSSSATFNGAVTLSSNVVAGGSQGTAGQSLQTNAGSAPTWVNVPSAILLTTSTWTANQIFSSATATNFNAQSGTFTATSNQLTLGSTTKMFLNANAPVANRVVTIKDVGADVNVVLSSNTSSIITPWTVYGSTLSAGWGTATNQSWYWRQVGDTVEIRGTAKTGTVAGSEANMTMPPNKSIDTTKIPSGTANTAVCGMWFSEASGNMGSANQMGPVFSDGSTTGTLYFGITGTSGSGITKGTGSGIFASTSFVNMWCNIPVQ